MLPVVLFGAAAAVAILSQERRERFGYGGASLVAKTGPELLRHNTAGVRGRPLWWRTPTFGADLPPWKKAILLSGEGKVHEARALFESSYPHLAHKRIQRPDRPPLAPIGLPPYWVALGLFEGVPVNMTRATRTILDNYPEFRT